MVEFLLQHGDIVPGDSFFSPERAQLGAEIHRKLQDKCKIEKKGYTSEKSLRCIKEKDGVLLELEGRCDGFYLEDDILHIDEFKTIEYHIQDNPDYCCSRSCETNFGQAGIRLDTHIVCQRKTHK